MKTFRGSTEFPRVNILSKSAPGEGGFEKNREEIQLEKNIDKTSTFLWFMDIFPVFDKFLPYSSLKDAMKIFTDVGKKNREDICLFLFEEGEKLELLTNTIIAARLEIL